MAVKWFSRGIQRILRSKPTSRNRNAYCSFCRQSHGDAGPLVEGPGEVYICGKCVQLCGSIIAEEVARRAGQPDQKDG